VNIVSRLLGGSHTTKFIKTTATNPIAYPDPWRDLFAWDRNCNL
jgi:hypothetical protein